VCARFYAMLRRFSPLVRRLSARSKERFRGEHQGRLPSKQARSRPPSNGSNTAYVGVMAQEVQTLRPAAVVRGRDGYLRVFYEQLGLTFQTYEEWLAAGARMPRAIQK